MNDLSTIAAAVGSRYPIQPVQRFAALPPPPPPFLEPIHVGIKRGSPESLGEDYACVMRGTSQWVDRRGFVEKYVIDPHGDRINPEDTFEVLWDEDAELLINTIAVTMFFVGYSLLLYRRRRNVR